MVHVAVFLTLYGIILITYPLVNGLCSTCKEKQCYDNGECKLDCMSGYVGTYCEKNCPSGCVNDTCHLDRVLGTVTCTDGCIPGYCSTKCSDPCPMGCVTCDRQCNSCNVTLCPERRYGADCKGICSSAYEKCDRETGQCIKCRQGYYGDECSRTCTSCQRGDEYIAYNCLSGCERCKSEEDSCPVGWYGESCGFKCSKGCDKQDRGCNRGTGECSAGCVSGYHGLNCNYTCNENCVNRMCNKSSGDCSTGCVAGYYGLVCNQKCSSSCEGGICNQQDGKCTHGKQVDEGNQDHTRVIVPVVLIICVAAAVVAFCFWRRRKNMRERQRDKRSDEDSHSLVILENELRMVLVGKTGVGKSATGNTIIGEEIFKVELSGFPVTKEAKQHTFTRFDQDLLVIDVPGFVDAKLNPDEIKQEVMRCVALSSPGLHAILYVVEIGRYGKDDEDSLEQFLAWFGEDALNYVIVIFTHFDKLKSDYIKLEDFFKTSPQGLTDFLIKIDNRYLAVNNLANAQGKKQFVDTFLTKVRELVQKNDDTFYTNEMYKQVETKLNEKIQSDIERLEREEKERDEQARENYERELEKLNLIQSEVEALLDKQRAKTDEERRKGVIHKLREGIQNGAVETAEFMKYLFSPQP